MTEHSHERRWSFARSFERMHLKHSRCFKRPSRTISFQGHSAGSVTRCLRRARRSHWRNPVLDGQQRPEQMKTCIVCVWSFVFRLSIEHPANCWQATHAHISSTWDSGWGSANVQCLCEGCAESVYRRSERTSFALSRIAGFDSKRVQLS